VIVVLDQYNNYNNNYQYANILKFAINNLQCIHHRHCHGNDLNDNYDDTDDDSDDDDDHNDDDDDRNDDDAHDDDDDCDDDDDDDDDETY